ncbi:hypothetical protein AcV5_002025 [Taiwanofungus camphoratus]|nr:hypothetical protein AcV5_002025 [Antrodia cinnamomea]KAI0943817.1 hypothetical protein AcV7_001802 [Antrodia cinnamomea]
MPYEKFGDSSPLNSIQRNVAIPQVPLSSASQYVPASPGRHPSNSLSPNPGTAVEEVQSNQSANAERSAPQGDAPPDVAHAAEASHANLAEVENRNAHSTTSSCLSYRSTPEVIPVPAPEDRLDWTVRVIRQVSADHHARYRDARILRERAANQAKEAKILRQRIAQEKAMRIRMQKYFTFWQPTTPEWTDPDLYGWPVKKMKTASGKLVEVDSDEDCEDEEVVDQLPTNTVPTQRIERKKRKAPLREEDYPSGLVRWVKADARAAPAAGAAPATAAEPLNSNGKRYHPTSKAQDEETKNKRSRTERTVINGANSKEIEGMDRMSPVAEDDEEEESNVIAILSGFLQGASKARQEQAQHPEGNTGNHPGPVDELAQAPRARLRSRRQSKLRESARQKPRRNRSRG